MCYESSYLLAQSLDVVDHLEAEVGAGAGGLLVVVVAGAGELLVIRLVVALLWAGSAHGLHPGHHQQHSITHQLT